VTAELCRTIAYEAVRRGARSNVHELWAVLERIDALSPRLIVDVGSGPAAWFAWWAMGAHVVGVQSPGGVGQSPAFSGSSLPESVVELTGDVRDVATVLRVGDQVAKRPVDVLVLSGIGTEDGMRSAFGAYGAMVRPGGLVLVHGIADRRTPGVGMFWRGLAAESRKELVGATDPIGYGVVEIQGKDRAAHV
jgi:hypothetical protein